MPQVRVAIQIKYDPHIRKRIQLEFFYHQATGASRAGPVNAIERIRWLIVSNAGNGWGHERDATMLLTSPGQLPWNMARRNEVHGAWVDDNSGLRCETHLALKEAEGVARGDQDVAERKLPARRALGMHEPTAPSSWAQEEATTRRVLSEIRVRSQFDPWHRQNRQIVYRDPFLEEPSYLCALCSASALDGDAAGRQPGPEPGEYPEEYHDVEHAIHDP